jgi:hypothetical protein
VNARISSSLPAIVALPICHLDVTDPDSFVQDQMRRFKTVIGPMTAAAAFRRFTLGFV